jgi:hypothetical protein
MRRTLAVIGVAGALAVGQLALAGPAGAKSNCTVQGTTVTCAGGNADGPSGGRGGAGNRNSFDPVTGDSSFSGGGGAGGGPGFGGQGSGFGEHCTGNAYDPFDPITCVGGGSPN